MRRTSAVIKALRTAAINKKTFGNGIPTNFSYMVGNKAVNLPIKQPKYRSKEDFLSDRNPLVFVEIGIHNLEWLYSFTDEICNSEVNKEHPFYNPYLDLASPGISAFKIYSPTSDSLQVQVTKIGGYNSLFQLDYYETTDQVTSLKFIVLCDMSSPNKAIVDIVYGTSNSTNMDYACKICSAFRSVLMYLRPWEYSKEYKYCEIVPIFNDESCSCWKTLKLAM